MLTLNRYLSIEAYSEPCQTSKMELFKKIVNIFAKRSILDVWQGSKYASVRRYKFPMYQVPTLQFAFHLWSSNIFQNFSTLLR